ncbi:MAG TPA: phage holin family protein [Verrucomicrobiae bacterium]|jgi:uncharacterized membrane protein YqjE|nr:phage holin family protein [Verrucomicrobiae bacterium]
MSEASETKSGVWASCKRILDALLAVTQNRVELLAVELQEEKCRLVEAILCATAVAGFAMMTLSLLTFTIVVLFWENGVLRVLLALSLLYLGGTVLAWRALQARLRKRSAFTETIAELQKDRACLDPEN